MLGLNINSVQNYLAKTITEQLSEQLETTVSVDNVDYRLFNTFRLHDFYVEDLQQDTLLYVKRLDVHFSFWRLFGKKFVANQIDVNQLDAKYLVDEKGENNFDFIFDAFSKEKGNKESAPFEFQLKNIEITNSSFTYKNSRLAQEIKYKDRFNASDICLKDIELGLSIDYLKKDSLRGTISNCSFLEQSGFLVKQMRAEVSGLKKGIHISNWDIQLPKSNVKIDDLSLKYDSISYLSQFVDKVMLNGNLTSSTIFFPDFAPFIPSLKKLNREATLQCRLQGRIASFRIFDFLFQYENNTFLKGNVDLNGINDIDEAFLFADIEDLYLDRKDLQDVIAKLKNRPFQLPQELHRLGNLKYKGNISGFFSNLVSYGNIFTNLGNIKTDILLKFTNKMSDLRYSGSISASNFQLGSLLNNKNLGKTSFTIKTKGEKLVKSSLKGTVKGSLKEFYFSDYLYKNIQLDGRYDPKGFDGKIEVDDDNINANFYGIVDVSHKIPRFNFDLRVKDADFHELQLTDKYPNTTFSFASNAKLQGNSIDDLDGSLLVDSLRIVNGNNDSFFLNNLKLDMFQSDSTQTNLLVKSKILNGKLKGDFRYSTLKQSLFAFLQQYIPSLISQEKLIREDRNEFQLDFKVASLAPLAKVLDLPFKTDSVTFIKGSFDKSKNSIDFHIKTGNLKLKKQEFRKLKFNINNRNNLLDVSLLANYLLKDDFVNINIINQAKLDSINTKIKWNAVDAKNYFGEIKSQTTFGKDENNYNTALVRFLPTEIVLADTVWNVHRSQVNIANDWSMNVHNFKVGNKNQHITANGFLSKQKEESLEINLRRIDLGFFIGLFNIKSLEIEGEITGNAHLYQVFNNPILESKLEIKKTTLNGTLLGDAKVSSELNESKDKLLVLGEFNQKSGRVGTANGFYNIKNNTYDFSFDVKKLSVGFLYPWLNTILSHIDGQATGLVRMFGDSEGIHFETNAFLKDAELTVGFLNTTYSFSDTISVKKESIEIKNVTIYDKYKNRGLVNALVTHDGNFKDFDYNVNLSANNMMVLDKPERDEIPFYGQAFMTGRAAIFGSQKEMATHINVNGKTEKNTDVHIIVDNGGTASDNSFITFVNSKDSLTKKQKKDKILSPKKNNLILKVALAATPAARVELLLNPQSGDKISANGAGNIRLDYNNAEKDIDIYGSYTIDKGSFLFSLQDLITKEFQIEQGSSIVWSGDILKANLDINAIYSLKASLSDLVNMNMISSSITRNNVPVNCLLHLEDELMKPKVTFDIDFPSSDETLKMQIKNLISTEDMLNRQVLYLLLFDRFYTDSSISQTNNAGGDDWGLLNSILTGQINSWLSKLNKNVTVGFNYRTSRYGQEVSQEYETTVSYQPNSRLIVNGNFGYRNDQLVKDKSNKIIGDVDIEYILTENRKWRIKAYNHTVDRYSLRSVPFVQGVGIMYKKDFDNWRELWNDLLRKKAKKKKLTDKQQNKK